MIAQHGGIITVGQQHPIFEGTHVQYILLAVVLDFKRLFVAFGGGTAIKLAKFLDSQGVQILGTSADAIDLAEDRERFEELCDKLNIKRPRGLTVFTEVEALESAEKIGYPVLMRPSYVLGGQNMIIARNSADVKE